VVFISLTNDPYELENLQSVTIMLSLHALLICTIVWPCCLSAKQKPRSKGGSERQSITGLTQFLDLPGGFETFMTYLESEFSSENLLFCQEVAEFKKIEITNTEELKDRATDIWNKFVEQGSPFQVNLSFQTVNEIRQQIEHSLSGSALHANAYNVFDTGVLDIISMLESDTFRRFQETLQYREFMTRIDGTHQTSVSIESSHVELAERLASGEIDVMDLRKGVKYSNGVPSTPTSVPSALEENSGLQSQESTEFKFENNENGVPSPSSKKSTQII